MAHPDWLDTVVEGPQDAFSALASSPELDAATASAALTAPAKKYGKLLAIVPVLGMLAGGAMLVQQTGRAQTQASPSAATATAAPAAPSAAAAPAKPNTVATVQGSLTPPSARVAKAPAATLGCLIGPMRVADIGSPVTGIVGQINVDIGDSVHQGQPLVVLRSEVEAAGERSAKTRWSIDADIRSAQASLLLANQRFTRATGLLAEGFVSPQAVEQARAEQEVAAQRVAQSKGQRDVLATDLNVVRAQVEQRTVRAPFDGVITERFRHPGERVEDRPVLRLATLNPLRVDLVVPAARFGQFKLRDSIAVQPELPGVSAANAEVTHVDRVIDAASNTYRVRLSLANPGNKLPAGARCSVDSLLSNSASIKAPGTSSAAAQPVVFKPRS
jgi:membrane fusion protein, heavy metal efflux system